MGFKHLDRDERHQFYLATELGAAVHRATSDGGDGVALYNITRTVDASPIAVNVPFETVVAFTSGQPMSAPTSPLDDLTAAVAALAAGFAELDAAVQTQVAALNVALAASGLAPATLRPLLQRAANIAHITRTMAADAEQIDGTG